MSDDEDNKEEKLPTDEELPTSTDGDESKKEEQLDDSLRHAKQSFTSPTTP